MAGLIYKELWHDKKVRTWTAEEGWLWVQCISYTEDHLAGGILLSEEEVALIAAMHRLSPASIQGLVEKKGLDAVEGGYEVHNYRTRGKLSRKRAKAGSLGGVFRQANLQATEQATGLANSGVGVVREVFETWKGVTGKTKAQLDPKRTRAILAALQEYPLEDVLDAVQGWQNDPWPERPLHVDLTVLLRDAAHIEKFRDFQRNGKPATQPQSQAVKNAMVLMGRRPA